MTHKHWYNGSPIWTNYYNALSILFPAWEKAFVSVVKAHLPNVKDVDLRNRMLQFIDEELSHARAHEAFNKRHDLLSFCELQEQNASVIHKRPKLKLWLGTMVSIEHLAVCVSRSFLENFPKKYNKNHKLFLWHSIEEIGHKSLAMDLWNYFGFSKKDLIKIVMLNQKYVLSFLLKYTAKQTYLGGDFKKIKTYFSFLNWILFMFGKIIVPMMTIYLPNFHPNSTDDSKYLQQFV
jgi:predicted metal-dependent hydrolase